MRDLKMNKIKLAPSMICSDLTQLGKQVEILDEAGVDIFHWDIMDGVFVHNFCLTPDIIAACRLFTDLPFDVHVALIDPASFITEIADAGADIVSLQFETTPHIFRAVDTIHKLGKKAGIVINPITPLSHIEHILKEIQMVTIMTVDLGFAGQKFIRPMLKKISNLRQLIQEHNLEMDIQVDGQINNTTYSDVIKAGANVLVVGTSGLFTVHDDLKTAVKIVRGKINQSIIS
jgi:ribulose-phosphate 3-epimerase